MCIRDRLPTVRRGAFASSVGADVVVREWCPRVVDCTACDCLLYTSDDADERSSVDLGGRRIIKKKKYLETARSTDKLKSITLN